MGQHSGVCSRLSGRWVGHTVPLQPSSASGGWSGPHMRLSSQLSANHMDPSGDRRRSRGPGSLHRASQVGDTRVSRTKVVGTGKCPWLQQRP